LSSFEARRANSGLFRFAREKPEKAGQSFFLNKMVWLFVSCACCRNLLTAGKGKGRAGFGGGQPKSGLLEDEIF
jgi:hypothetical protein